MRAIVDILLPLAALVLGTFAGGVVPLMGRWRRESLSLLLSFGSGVLLAVIFLQMLPAAVGAIGAWGGLAMLGGFVLTSLIEANMHAHRHSGGHTEGKSMHTASLAVAIGLGVHSVLDGLALGTGMTLTTLAPALFFAILIHKGPDAFALSTVLMAAGHPVGRIVRIQGLFSLATPLAAVLAYFLLRGLPAPTVGFALGAAAGSLLAVASEDLLPEVHRRGGKGFMLSTLLLLLGISLVAAYQFLFAVH